MVLKGVDMKDTLQLVGHIYAFITRVISPFEILLNATAEDYLKGNVIQTIARHAHH